MAVFFLAPGGCRRGGHVVDGCHLLLVAPATPEHHETPRSLASLSPLLLAALPFSLSSFPPPRELASAHSREPTAATDLPSLSQVVWKHRLTIPCHPVELFVARRLLHDTRVVFFRHGRHSLVRNYAATNASPASPCSS